MRNGSHRLLVKLCCIMFDWFYLLELGYPARESGVFTLRGIWELEYHSSFVCVAPLRLEGDKGEEKYP
jgi:hypothetical protein